MEDSTGIMNGENFLAIIILVSLIVLTCLGSFYMKVLVPFYNERRYIKMEIERSSGKKKDYWKRQLKILYLLHIPIIGPFIINKIYRR